MNICACCGEPILDKRRKKYCTNWCMEQREEDRFIEFHARRVIVSLANDEAYGLIAPSIKHVLIGVS